jgi:ligand-binding SRPBCC domain-containing protein
MALFESKIEVNTDPGTLFDYIIRPDNIVNLAPSPPTLKFLDAPEKFSHNIQFEFQILGIGPLSNIVYEIIHFEEPSKFIEKQIDGPLESFVQEHHLEVLDNGRTLLYEKIEFEPPGGIIGFMMTEDRIRESLTEGYEYREYMLSRVFKEE